MAAGDLPEELDARELCRRCREQVARFRRLVDFDDRYCFEMMRRAIVSRDDVCWRELEEIYGDLVLAWVRRVNSGQEQDERELQALCWERFWRSFTEDKLKAADGTRSVLRYLKMCVWSVVINGRRRRPADLSLDALSESLAIDWSAGFARADGVMGEAFWQMVAKHLLDERERVLVHLRYVLGLKSSQILERRPDLFTTIEEVYRLSRNILDRLRRSQDMREWLDGNGA